MTLFVSTNASDEFVLEHDYGGGRAVLIEDAGGPGEGLEMCSWGVPKRVQGLCRQAMYNEWDSGRKEIALQVMADASTENIVDER